MNYIKQVAGEMRRQPLAVWLSVAGTALSIFLVMVVYILNDLPSVPAKPESCRRLLMVADGIDISQPPSGYSGPGMSKKWADILYGNLEGIEKMSCASGAGNDEDVKVAGEANNTAIVRSVDDVFWEIFDIDFIAGKPFTKAEVEDDIKVAILSEKTARMLFGSTDVVGKEFQLRQIPYVVKGVVQDINPLFDLAYSEIYTPVNLKPVPGYESLGEFIGDIQVILLKKDGVPDKSIVDQVRKRYESANVRLSKNGCQLNYHEMPYSMKIRAVSHGTNSTPDPSSGRKLRYFVYGILLLIPAINLSGMSRSRLRARVSEIGVRRVYGATRLGVTGQLLCENLIVTILGGVIGLIVCVLFTWFFSNVFFNLSNSWSPSEAQLAATPSFSMLFTWNAFGFAILFCLFLNLLSAGLPVWRAASINPAEAISGNENFKK